MKHNEGGKRGKGISRKGVKEKRKVKVIDAEVTPKKFGPKNPKRRREECSPTSLARALTPKCTCFDKRQRRERERENNDNCEARRKGKNNKKAEPKIEVECARVSDGDRCGERSTVHSPAGFFIGGRKGLRECRENTRIFKFLEKMVDLVFRREQLR